MMMMMMVSFFIYERLVVHCTTWSWYWESKSCNLITALICNRERERDATKFATHQFQISNSYFSPNIQKFQVLLLLDLLHEDGDLILGESKAVSLPAPVVQALQGDEVKQSWSPNLLLLLKRPFLNVLFWLHVINNHWRWYINSIWFSFCPCSVWPKKLLR